MQDVWTIRRVVEWTAKDFASRGIESPKLDAELLAAHALRLDRVRLYLDLDRPLTKDELTAVRALVERRRRREPVAYLLGQRDFFGMSFEVDARVLIPRPDTEILVLEGLRALGVDARGRPLSDAPGPEAPRALDLCTGSGAVACALAKAVPTLTVRATDLSADALAVAARNVAAHGLEARVKLGLGDLFDAARGEAPFDLVTANPPYIPASDIPSLMPDVARFEPHLALDGGDGGLVFYPRIFEGARTLLQPEGVVAVEVGAGQADAVVGIARGLGYRDVRSVPDYGSVLRVVVGRRPIRDDSR